MNATQAEPENRKFVHPALKPKRSFKSDLDRKQRRTIVRTAKLINMLNEDARGERIVNLVQVPIEPSHNNGGNLYDPTGPLRFYLNKGFIFPPDYDPVKYDFVYCAVSNCWDKALVSFDENGSERCSMHEEMWNKKLIGYATEAREPR